MNQAEILQIQPPTTTNDQQNVTPLGEESPPEKEKRLRMPSNYLKSPMQSRIVDITAPVHKAENAIYDWIMEDEDLSDQIFTFRKHKLIKKDFQSFKLDTWLESHILDIWADMQNELEKYKCDEKPARLFIQTDFVNTAMWMEDSEEIWLNMFIENLNEAHFALFAFNIKVERLDIIDNSIDGETEIKYGLLPNDLPKFLAAYLRSKGLEQMAKSVENAKKTRLEMLWRCNENKMDCGIFVMRHMETYFGNGMQGFVTGLEKKTLETIRNARYKYLAYILGSPMNERKLKCASSHLTHQERHVPFKLFK